jgi:hypothetical protein
MHDENKLELFKKLHEISGEIIEAWDDAEKLETAFGKFFILMLKMQEM